MKTSTLFTKSELGHFNNSNPIFTSKQISLINKKTPSSQIEIKKEEDTNHKYKSIKSDFAKMFVNMVTGGNYEFHIKNREYISSTKQTLVEARLTIYKEDGSSKYREQFGIHHLNNKSSKVVDIANGYKSAASDAFKKCASEFGFFWDIYGQEKIKQPLVPEIDQAEQKKLDRLSIFLSKAETAESIESTYEKFIESSEETESSKKLLEEHMTRVLNLKN